MLVIPVQAPVRFRLGATDPTVLATVDFNVTVIGDIQCRHVGGFLGRRASFAAHFAEMLALRVLVLALLPCRLSLTLPSASAQRLAS